MNRKLRIFIISLFFLLFLQNTLFTAAKLSLKLSGNSDWSISLGPADIVGGAGSDFTSLQESPINQLSMDITKTAGGTASWICEVQRADTVWHANFRLYVMRTSDGTGTGSITGGTTYHEVTTTATSFFSGDSDRANIDIQIKIEGVSAVIGINDFDTSISYIVTEI